MSSGKSLDEAWERYCRQWAEMKKEYAYIEGYLNAAEHLARGMAERRLFGLEWPTLYLYRHYLELAIKHLQKELSDGRSARPVHDLRHLWASAKRTVSYVLGKEWLEKEPAMLVDQLVALFDKLDPASDRFRYSRDKHGKEHKSRLGRADFAVLSDRMRQAHWFFEGTLAWVEERQYAYE